MNNANLEDIETFLSELHILVTTLELPDDIIDKVFDLEDAASAYFDDIE